MPEFRFWGSRDPRGRRKPAILAATPGATVDEDGVAVVRLYDPIDSWGGDWGVSAREFLQTLDKLGDASTIRLHLNSPGGEVYEAIAITNALRAHPARVVAVVDGLAASAASFVAASADELVMGRNTELMIHDAWGVGIGPAATMRDLADRLDHVSDNIASIYLAKAGGTVEEWRDRMLAETWFSAEDAVDVGLADAVDTPAAAPAEGDDAEDAIAARFDLSIFRARSHRPPPRTAPREPVLTPEQRARAARFAARARTAVPA